MFFPVFIQGLLLGFGLIVAIGAQNAFVLRQGLRNEHVGSVVAFCALADAVLITAGVMGMAQALGETAPLLLIGMVAFVKNFPGPPPEGLFDPASALPVQVYNWTQRADPAFIERASGAIIVLLVFLLCMNLFAVFLRRKFERRW